MSRLWILLVALGLPLAGQVKITQSSDRISVEIDGKPYTALFVGAGANKPYLHPLRSASGKQVTRSFPMEMVEGERRDHPHHRGLWFAHGDVNGFDYWTNEDSQKRAITGRIALKKVGDVKNGKKSGGFTAVFDWLDPAGKPILTESRRTVFRAEPNLRAIDFDITLTPAGSKVTFGDTKEGTFAMRLAAGLEEDPKGAPAVPKRTGRMVNAEGATGEPAVWGKRSNWVDYYGEVDGEKLGVAILDHPGNPRYPTYWMSRAYGLFAVNVFGVREFERDKSKDGSLTIQAGHTLRFRYRVIVHSGDAQSAGIGAQWARWAGGK